MFLILLKQFSTVTSPELRKAISEINSPEIQVKEEIEDGLNQIYRIKYGSENAILKIHTEKKHDNFYHDYEGLLLQQMNMKNEPVPEVYRISESAGHSFFIMEEVEGVSGNRIPEELGKNQLENLVQTFGSKLREIHENHEFGSFAYLRRNKGEIRQWKKFESWQAMLSTHIEDDLESLEKSRFSDSVEDLRSEYIASKNALERDYRPVLIHDDNRFSNLIVNEGELKSIIDWATGYNGAPEFDIARAEFLLIDHDLRHFSEKRKEELRDSLYKGYGKDFRGSEVGKVHRLASLIYTMKGFSNWKDSYSKSERKTVAENLERKVNEISG
jgi:aminoglycoside phosphotransferase (APT) family kinase protein